MEFVIPRVIREEKVLKKNKEWSKIRSIKIEGEALTISRYEFL